MIAKFGPRPATAPDGLYPELLEGMKKMKPDDLAGSPFQQAYARTAPNPEDWPTLIEKFLDAPMPERT